MAKEISENIEEYLEVLYKFGITSSEVRIPMYLQQPYQES